MNAEDQNERSYSWIGKAIRYDKQLQKSYYTYVPGLDTQCGVVEWQTPET